MNIYIKVINAILDKEIDKYIKYEKLFINFNDIIIDITYKLNLNF